MKTIAEVVLPSGRFAAMREPLVADLLAARTIPHPDIALAIRTVQIDGEPLTMDQVLGMTAEEYMPIYNMIEAYAVKVGKFKKGIV